MISEEGEELLSCNCAGGTDTAMNGCMCNVELHRRNSVIISQAVNRSIFTADISPATERICIILSEEEEPKTPLLFTELDELFPDNENGLEWKETARWMKFEEKIEEGGEKWSKPHVSTLPLHSVFEFRTCIETGILFFDLEASNFKEIVETIVNEQIAKGLVTSQLKEKVMYVLLRNHRHHIKMSRIRVLAELGKKISCANKSSTLNGNKSDGLNEISEKPLNEQLKNEFKKKIPEGAEATNVLVGEVDFLDKPLVAFVRLQQAVCLGAVTEVPVPTRFLFVLLGPKAKAMAYHQIGRAVATLLTDELFHIMAFKAMSREDLIAGIDEFLDEVTVLPPGKWDPTVRIAPPKVLPPLHKRKSIYSRKARAHTHKSTRAHHEERHGSSQHIGEDLKSTGKLFGGLIGDVRRKAPWFASDFYDALNIQCLSAVLFIYLATVTNAITFGGMLGDATGNVQGVLESFLGTAVAGAVFCLFAGQPLTILSSTGPVLVFERLLFNFTRAHSLVYLEFRLWIGIWTAFFCLLLVATDASYLVQYFTRFTEEGFCTLISFIFIHDALQKMFSLAEDYPIWSHFDAANVTLYRCLCLPPPNGNDSRLLNETAKMKFQLSTATSNTTSTLGSASWSTLTRKGCLELGGQLVGRSCHFIPDITLMSFILFFGTFLCVLLLKNFKTSRYFPTTVRKLISDFSTVLSILIFCGVDILVGVDTPKLIVPSEFKPTDPERDWFVCPVGGNAWWLCLVAAVPAVLVTILLFMDQQITAVLLNRKDTNSREQRVTGLAVFLLTGLSLFLAPILKYIPMPVLYGIFLYMGVAALSSVQLLDRLKLLLMPAKHQPDLLYLRHVPLRRVHLFTLFQVVCLVLLWGLKSTAAAIIFPIMLLALVGVRKGMERVFSRHDLSWLDDMLPERENKEEQEEEEKGKKETSNSESDDSEYIYLQKGPEINISVN